MDVAVKHNGIITKVTPSSVDVIIEEERGKCSGCAVSMFCGFQGSEKLSVVTFSDRDYDLSSYKIGDKISLSFSGATQLKASLLVMGIPSLLLLCGVLLALYSGISEGLAVMLGLLLVGIYIFILYRIRNRIRSQFRWILLGKSM